MSELRFYSYRDIDMLMGAEAVATRLEENIAELGLVKTIWTVEYAQALKTRAHNGITQFLGVDNKMQLRLATQNIRQIQYNALNDLALLRIQIKVDLPDHEEILKELGFDHWEQARVKHDQEALIQLLSTFGANITGDLIIRLVEKGVANELLDRVTSYLTQIEEADILQENLKVSTKSLTSEAIAEFNDIYNTVIGICKIASSFYHDQPIKRESFTFKKIMEKMNFQSNPQPEETEQDQ